MLQKIGTAAAQPFMPTSRENSLSLRRTLGYAGIYSPAAFKLITGRKVIFMVRRPARRLRRRACC